MAIHQRNNHTNQSITRRQFAKTASLVLGASALPIAKKSLFAAGNDRLKVALIGCGGRGKRCVRKLS